jgi:hypothetical protein
MVNDRSGGFLFDPACRNSRTRALSHAPRIRYLRCRRGYSSIVTVVQQLGLPALIIREERLTEELMASAFTINLLITVALCAVIAAIGLTQGLLFEDPG